MNQLRPNTVGMALGVLLALCHFFWAILVWLGVAQGLMDFIFNLHMITPVFAVSAFSITKATMLVIVTGAIGYVSGVVFALVWNRCH